MRERRLCDGFCMLHQPQARAEALLHVTPQRRRRRRRDARAYSTCYYDGQLL